MSCYLKWRFKNVRSPYYTMNTQAICHNPTGLLFKQHCIKTITIGFRHKIHQLLLKHNNKFLKIQQNKTDLN